MVVWGAPSMTPPFLDKMRLSATWTHQHPSGWDAVAPGRSCNGAWGGCHGEPALSRSSTGGLIAHGIHCARPQRKERALLTTRRWRPLPACCSSVLARRLPRRVSPGAPRRRPSRPSGPGALTDVALRAHAGAGRARALPRDRRDRLRALPLGTRPQPARSAAGRRDGSSPARSWRRSRATGWWRRT